PLASAAWLSDMLILLIELCSIAAAGRGLALRRASCGDDGLSLSVGRDTRVGAVRRRFSGAGARGASARSLRSPDPPEQHGLQASCARVGASALSGRPSPA